MNAVLAEVDELLPVGTKVVHELIKYIFLDATIKLFLLDIISSLTLLIIDCSFKEMFTYRICGCDCCLVVSLNVEISLTMATST